MLGDVRRHSLSEKGHSSGAKGKGAKLQFGSKMARGEENEGGVKEKIKEEGGERSRCRRCQR